MRDPQMPAVDLPKLLSATGGRTELARKMASLFLEEKARQVAAIRAALGSADLPQAALLAHRIKGNLLLLKARPGAEIAAGLEEALLRGDRTSAEAALPSFEEELDCVGSALAGLFPDPSPGATVRSSEKKRP